ncbi:hypothetical protein [Nocardia lasii]|uniref:Uncharacterized protein n=1 Tax=Nocardia lasii TaxID=1616107 RepID=A0ABW1JQS8_9NOCA
MDGSDSVALQATDVWYYSPHDETAFFEWLGKIRAVRSFGGELRTLEIVVSTPIDEESLRELLALFRRYDIDMAPLRVLGHPAVDPWFHDPRKYWHTDVFGTPHG